MLLSSLKRFQQYFFFNIQGRYINIKKTNHHVCIEEAKVLAIEENYNKRRIREAIEIEKHPKKFNRDDGLTLGDTWKPIIHSLQNIKIIR